MHEETVLNHPETSARVESTREPEEQEIDLLELVRILLQNKILILKFALVTAVITAIVLLIKKPYYQAQATFLPPNSMSTGGSSALLGQLGALGSAGSALSGLKDPTLIYVGILESRTVADDLIHQFDLAKVYKTKKLSQTEKVLKSHTKIFSGKDTIVVINVEDGDPKRAADLANAYLAALHKQNDRIAFTEAGQRRRFFEQQLEKEKNSLADAEVELKRTEEQSGLIHPSGQAQIQLQTIAETQAQITNREVQLEALSQGATSQNPEVVRIRSEIEALKAQLNRLENSSAKGAVGNPQVPTSKVPELELIYVRKARDVKYHEALYELLLRQYETAKLDEARSAPLMQEVDYAVVPDTKAGLGRTLMTIFAALVGGMVGIIWVVVRETVRGMSLNAESEAKLKAVFEAARLGGKFGGN
ncbi:uncharacterized protein involved in exopolysaccharide biosynthesis [Edaphobacter aggregans]|uniref:Uncharacterized protein involved in exopolysaccharide biosynthesis n=1 Tax=Edaphobacter aggregans TaxID=570835 RepID=A0A428MI41_9BACT|nr:Wzz/FepE/Etk N-terminal domain-containing protein [Edaphobacter aggregans]RSL16403.1 uncharacterized protein involved in exopolysaccharide biosynthesis [Edaphobacter aggregans]